MRRQSGEFLSSFSLFTALPLLLSVSFFTQPWRFDTRTSDSQSVLYRASNIVPQTAFIYRFILSVNLDSTALNRYSSKLDSKFQSASNFENWWWIEWRVTMRNRGESVYKWWWMWKSEKIDQLWRIGL